MARKKSIEEDTLIKIVTEYHLDHPEETLTIPAVGKYLRNLGYDIKDYTLRRYSSFRTYLEDINKKTEAVWEKELITYSALDIDSFLNKNNSRVKLQRALAVRDEYYSRVAAAGANAVLERKKTEKRAIELESRVSELEAELLKTQVNVDNAAIKEKNKTIAKLKEVLELYVYPDAANAILQKAGILEVVAGIIPDDKMDSVMIAEDTDIEDGKEKSKYKSVNKLLSSFID